MRRLRAEDPCPCLRGAPYRACCQPLHDGAPAPNPEALMRSRYAAYAGGVCSYILDTTDPAGPHAQAHRGRWLREVRAFCEETEFVGLDVLEHREDGDEGFVTFRARLRQRGRDASFVERSRFVREGGRWLYHDGQPGD